MRVAMPAPHAITRGTKVFNSSGLERDATPEPHANAGGAEVFWFFFSKKNCFLPLPTYYFLPPLNRRRRVRHGLFVAREDQVHGRDHEEGEHGADRQAGGDNHAHVEPRRSA